MDNTAYVVGGFAAYVFNETHAAPLLLLLILVGLVVLVFLKD